MKNKFMFFSSLSERRKKEYIFIVCILLPTLSLFFLLRIYPMIQSFILSFRKYDILSPTRPFVGFTNYKRLFSSDRSFCISLKNTLLFAGITVPANLLIGLFLALLLRSRKKKSPFFEALFFVPYMVPVVPIAIVWQWMYNPNGILNAVLTFVGLRPMEWMTGPMALFSIMFLFIWQMNGYLMIVFLVGLRGIPNIYHEAASIDGANQWQAFWRVTLPLLKPIILYGTVIATVWAFTIFSQVYVMTQGSDVAPGGSVKVLALDIYQKGFNYFKMGLASAEAVILFIVIMFITIAQLKLGKQSY